MLDVICWMSYAGCHYAGCHYAVDVIMLDVIILDLYAGFDMLDVIMLDFICWMSCWQSLSLMSCRDCPRVSDEEKSF
jgi:hypothetical protein